MTQEIFIMMEQKEGVLEEPSFSLLSEGKGLRERLGSSHLISAIVMGDGIRNLERELGSWGADRVYYFESPLLKRYQSDFYLNLLSGLVGEKNPDFFLFGATSLGNDLAPRLAARLRVGLITHCVDLYVDQNRVEVVKSISDQFLHQKLVFRHSGLRIITFSLHALMRGDQDFQKRAEVIKISPKIEPGQERVRFVNWLKADPKTIGLEEADIIVCGGRGVGKKTFEIVHQLADAINGSVGGTRPVIDWGILPYERQIGQTGVEVSPTLLMALGISGANEFTVGIEGSKMVIAINMDRKARIFKFADLGIIGDIHQVMPLVIDQIKKVKKES